MPVKPVVMARAVSHLTWVLVAKLGYSAKTKCALNP